MTKENDLEKTDNTKDYSGKNNGKSERMHTFFHSQVFVVIISVLIGIGAGYLIGLGRTPFWNGWKSDWTESVISGISAIVSLILLVVTFRYNHALLAKMNFEVANKAYKNLEYLQPQLSYRETVTGPVEACNKYMQDAQNQIYSLLETNSDEDLVDTLSKVIEDFSNSAEGISKISDAIKKENLVFPVGTSEKKVETLAKETIDQCLKTKKELLDLNKVLELLRMDNTILSDKVPKLYDYNNDAHNSWKALHSKVYKYLNYITDTYLTLCS